MSDPADPPVDFVILWVDGSDPATSRSRDKAAARQSAAGVPVKEGANRHRDNGELLFLLRAIEKHMPWYRRIVLVTNGQKPPYVDLSSPRIRLVAHAEIFPNGDEAPSFNTYAIDACLSRIDGLSDIYVRFSDDFFVGRDVSKRDFLSADNLGRHYVGAVIFGVGPANRFQQTLQANAVEFWQRTKYMPLDGFLHVPQLRHRAIVDEMEAEWPDWFANTRASRFRTTSDLNLLFLYPYFALLRHRFVDLQQLALSGSAPGIVNVRRMSRGQLIYQQVQAGARIDWRPNLDRISRDPPAFFNINDDHGDVADEEHVAFIGEQLVGMFPAPSSLECNPDTFPGYAAAAASPVST